MSLPSPKWSMCYEQLHCYLRPNEEVIQSGLMG